MRTPVFSFDLEALGDHEVVELLPRHLSDVQTLQLRLARQEDQLRGFTYDRGEALEKIDQLKHDIHVHIIQTLK